MENEIPVKAETSILKTILIKVIQEIEEDFSEQEQTIRAILLQLLIDAKINDQEIFLIGNANKNCKPRKSRRASKFRGVSLNGRKW